MGRIRRPGERGQILPLFVLSLVVLIAMAALLFDGAGAFATRRRLQNAGDAAALAGSNVIQTVGSIRKCSATDGPPPGSPRNDVIAAVQASLNVNVPGIDLASVTITCAPGWDNQAVTVTVNGTAPNFFAGAVIGSPIGVGVRSTAVNGRIGGTNYSIIQLDPYNSSWPSGRRGCPSLLFSGGPTVIFEGSVQVNSACPASNGGALGTNGSSATVTLTNSSRVLLTGGYSPGPLTISPTPLTGQRAVNDPLAFIDTPTLSAFTLRSASKLTLNNTSQVLSPGIYRGGIELRNSSIAYLLPGVYILDGGGLSLGAQSSFFSIDTGRTSTSSANWASDCADITCGVMIFNTGTASGSGAVGQIAVGAGATMKLRAYDERGLGNAYPDYRNLLIFQDRTPAPSSSYAQPTVLLRGGGNINVSGTVYAPGAPVSMGGSSGGAGGGNTDLTLQFVTWDLEFQGNAAFRFFYSDAEFVRPTDYGLIE